MANNLAIRKLLGCCVGLLLLAVSMSAQVTTGAIVGTVHDQTGAVVQGAKVEATNQDTGIKSTAVSGADGLFSIRELFAGTYSLEISNTGFRTVKQGPVSLSSTQQLEVNVSLSPGSVSETVQVTAEGQLLQTQDSAVKSQVSQTQIDNMPLQGRSPSELVLLGPSVSIAQQASSGSSLGFTINGQNQGGSSLRLDGIDNSIGTDTGFYFGSLNFNLNMTSMDSVQEFDIQTENYSADSKGSSGYVNVITKTGTNQLHYDFYDFFRNGAMDATPYFATSTGKGSLKLNDFGGMISGPIKKNKAFFMLSYEGQRIHFPYPGFAVVPTASFRATVDPRLAPFLDATPLPTSAIAGDPDLGNYQNTVETNTRQDLATGRIDYNFSEKDRVFVRYVMNDGVVSGAQSVQGGTTANGLSIFPGYGFLQPSRHQTAAFDWDHTFSTSFLNDFKLGLNRYRETRLRGDPSIFDLPNITIPGVIVSGGGNKKHWGVTEGEIDDKATWVNGKSTLSFGGDYTYWVSGLNQVSVAVLTFPDLPSFAADEPATVSDGLGFTGHEPEEHIHNGQWAGFVQEDYRVAPRLTVNVGVRYDNFGVMVDSTRNAVNVQDGPFSPFRAPGQPLYNSNNHDFSPRFGFSWQPLEKMPFVLRGGIGIYYGERATGQAGDIFEYNKVGSFSVSSLQLPGLAYPFPPELATFAANSPGRHIMDPNSKDLSTVQWNLTAQQQIGRATSLEVAYVGNHQIHLPGETLPNVINPLTGTTADPSFGSVAYIQSVDSAWYHSLQVSLRHRLSSNLASDTYYTWSHATGLETGLFEVSAAVGGGHEQVQTYTNRNLNSDNMPFDMRHQFTQDLTYMLPRLSGSNGVVRSVLGGWSTSGILKVSSGLPFIVFTGLDAGDGTFEQRPNPVAGVSPYLNAEPGHGFLNPAAWSVPTLVDPGTGLKLGYEPNNSINMPYNFTMNWAFAKKLYTSEKFAVDFRGELFNMLNHPVFANPVATLSSPNFGKSQTASDPRVVQLMLRFSF
ncbi:MAG TPA: TonB-dependent receptor [Terriglobales bacterium]|nr:TonB-dependent receptor [Terriglobales bacterium]